MNTKKRLFRLISGLLVILLAGSLFAQEPYRVGTTTANFLEIGVGGAANAMGDAYVAMATDITAAYWNPAGLAFMEKSEAMFVYQPWVVDINANFAGVGIVLPMIGTLGFSLYQTSYGEMDVTTVDYMEGTGESFTAGDYAFALTYGRKLAQWFSFGASAKYINSKIWHCSASAFAVDLGVYISTHFFSPTDRNEDGLKIGMSISNYGTRMKFDGMDLLQPIDIDPYEVGGYRNEGNYKDARGKFDLQGWELPLIFRVGVAMHPIATDKHRVTIAADALHPNNNQESLNIGGEYRLMMPGFGEVALRAGYKALFMDESQFGPTFGAGVLMRLTPAMAFKLDYSYRTVGILGNSHIYGFSIMF